MTFEQILNERGRESFAEGEAIGLKKGRSEGEAIGLEKGRSEGEAIGLEKGAAQKQHEIAKSMKAKKIPTADIAEITGLSAEEVEAL